MGRGSSKAGGGNRFKFGHAGGGGNGTTTPDLPARMNTKVDIRNKNPEAVLDAFRKLHANDNYESAVTVDENGYVTQYVHGGATSVNIMGRKGEMVYHNHPSGGAFSDSDLISTAQSPEKGIVASGKNGDYIFIKSRGFDGPKFVAAIKKAQMYGTSYDDAVDRWLSNNQRRYGYKYVFKKAGN